MALVQCRECGKEISDQAEMCPHCGIRHRYAPAPIKSEVKGKPNGSSGCAVLFVLVLVFVAIVNLTGEDNPAPKGPSSSEIASSAKCKADLECLRTNLRPDVTYECQRAIESRAKWDFEWTDGFGETKFPSFTWANPERTAVALGGNKLKMQNGFGAWKHVIYICEVDIGNKAIIGATVVE